MHHCLVFVVLKTMAFAPSVSKMLADLELENMTSRRSSWHLVFLYKIFEGLVPAIYTEEFVVKT